MYTEVTTAILGGGLSGITLARILHGRGEDVFVLEAEQAIGGLCRSRNDAGFCFDTGGSHIIFSRDREVLDFMLSVLGENRDERVRNTRIFYKDRYVKYPFENGLSDLPKEDRYFCLSEFIKTLIAAEKGELPPIVTFADWITSTFGTSSGPYCVISPHTTTRSGTFRRNRCLPTGSRGGSRDHRSMTSSSPRWGLKPRDIPTRLSSPTR